MPVAINRRTNGGLSSRLRPVLLGLAANPTELIITGGADEIGLAIQRCDSTQSAKMLDIEDEAGASLASISAAGVIAGPEVDITTAGNGSKGLTVKRKLIGQTANLVEVQSEGGTPLFIVDKAGNINAASGTAPANATAAGFAGQIAYDATHIYVCIATNVWVRATLATW